MKKIIDDYFAHMRAQGRSEQTIRVYRHDLETLAAHLGDVDPKQITSAMIDGYAGAVRQCGNSPATINRKLSAMRSLFTWLLDSGQVDVNPARLIRTKRVESAPRHFLSTVEKNRLLRELKTSADPQALRDRAMVHLMLATGIRIAELVHLDIDDVLDEKRLRIKSAKGGKMQTKFLGKEIAGTLRLWLKERSKMNDASPALFPGRGASERFTPEQVRRRLAEWCRKADVPVVSPHELRHTFATQLLAKTGNVRLAQVALGHKRLETTAIYTHVTDEDLQEAVEGM